MNTATPYISICHIRGGAICTVSLLPSADDALSISLTGAVSCGTRGLCLLPVEGAPEGYFICEVAGVQDGDNPIAYDVSIQQSFSIDGPPSHVVILYRCGGKRHAHTVPVTVIYQDAAEEKEGGMQPLSPAESTDQPIARGASSSMDFGEAYKEALGQLLREVRRYGYRESFGVTVNGQRLVQTALPVPGFPKLEVTLEASGVRMERTHGHPEA